MDHLDSFGEEISSLCVVVRGRKSTSQLVNNVQSRVLGLEVQSGDTKHSQTSVLDFLQLLLCVFFGGVGEAERIPAASTLSKTDVSVDVALSLGLHVSKTLGLNPSHEGNDLEGGDQRNFVEGIKREKLTVGIKAGPGSGLEGSEKSGPDETNNGQLGDTAVGELGLTVPSQTVKVNEGW